MSKTSQLPELMRDSTYLEPDTVRIVVKGSSHHGKVWQHTHNFYEFVYVDSGFSLHSYNNKTSVLTGGDLFAIFPGDVHSYISAFHTDIYNVLFYLEDLGSLRDEVLKLPGITRESGDTANRAMPIIRVGLSERRELVSLLERMRWERTNKAVGWELNLKGLLVDFLVMYSRLLSETEQSEDGSGKACDSDMRGYCGYIYSVLRFVEENYASDITAKDIAASAGISGDYLARQFKAVMSMTPADYVRRFRIAKSMDLLQTTELSIAEIAEAVGFGNISLYSRVFKQMLGVSPAAFRKG